LEIPRVIQPLSGHRAVIERIVWSSNNRHLVSLDSSYEVRVWDVTQARLVDMFQAPRGDGQFYAHNAVVALSGDVQFVHHASGGDKRADALMRDILKNEDLGKWPLKGGYENLAFADGKFILVREEDAEEIKEDRVGAKRVTHGVAYEWVVGKPPAHL